MWSASSSARARRTMRGHNESPETSSNAPNPRLSSCKLSLARCPCPPRSPPSLTTTQQSTTASFRATAASSCPGSSGTQCRRGMFALPRSLTSSIPASAGDPVALPPGRSGCGLRSPSGRTGPHPWRHRGYRHKSRAGLHKAGAMQGRRLGTACASMARRKATTQTRQAAQCASSVPRVHSSLQPKCARSRLARSTFTSMRSVRPTD